MSTYMKTIIMLSITSVLPYFPMSQVEAAQASVDIKAALNVGGEKVQAEQVHNRNYPHRHGSGVQIYYNYGYPCDEWYFYNGRWVYYDCGENTFYYRYGGGYNDSYYYYNDRYPYRYRDSGFGIRFNFGGKSHHHNRHRGDHDGHHGGKGSHHKGGKKGK